MNIYSKENRDKYRVLYAEGLENRAYRIGRNCKVCGCDVRYMTNKRCVSCKHRMDAELYLKRKALKQVLNRHEID